MISISYMQIMKVMWHYDTSLRITQATNMTTNNFIGPQLQAYPHLALPYHQFH